MIKSPALTGDQGKLIGAHPNAISDPSNWAAFTGHLAELIVIDGKVTESQMTAINAYLSKKWNLTSTVDSDGDGFTDAIEIAAGSLVTDDASTPAGIPAVIADAKLWLDATNVDGNNNQTLSDGDAVSTWMDLSGVGTHATAALGSAPLSSNDAIVFDGNDSFEVPIQNALTQSSDCGC